VDADTRRYPLRLSAFVCVLLFCVAGCTPRQEAQEIVDLEPERQINTDLTFPKNPRRWAFVSTRVTGQPGEPFPGFQVVAANPFAARLLEEGKTADRGVKFAQFVYDTQTGPMLFQPGELRRVNLLVQDPDRYAETGGWGYASYDGAGQSIAVNAATDCISCHKTGPITPYFPSKAAGKP